MRLINVNTMELKEFDNEIPSYAILSHRWEKEEVTFQDYAQPESRRKKAGYPKIRSFCRLAREDGHLYAWVDTCCIDKTSSAELSEAINSMFAWYRRSKACYAYLSDVTPTTRDKSDPYDRPLRVSKWFTRGWTLQELLAPARLKFYDVDWKFIGTRNDRSVLLQDITGIKTGILSGVVDPVPDATVAEKFSWASQRQTTRPEDMAYCLLGLLDVNMPLLYGEGHKAFRRLQEEFMRTHLDLSLLTWGMMAPSQIHMGFSNGRSGGTGCLANTVHQFRRWAKQGMVVLDTEEHHTTTNAGLLLPVKARAVDRADSICLGFIPLKNIRYGDKNGHILAIPLVWSELDGGPTKAQRADGNAPFWVPPHTCRPPIAQPGIRIGGRMEDRTYLVSPPQIHVIPSSGNLKSPMYHQYFVNDYAGNRQFLLNFDFLGNHGYHVADFYPPDAFRNVRLMSIEPEGHALLRFTRPLGRDLFLLQWVNASGPTLSLGTAPESFTTWEHLLRPDYDKISFRRPIKSFFWFSNIRLNGLRRGSQIFIDVQKKFNDYLAASITANVGFRIIEAKVPDNIPISYNSNQADQWSVSAEIGIGGGRTQGAK